MEKISKDKFLSYGNVNKNYCQQGDNDCVGHEKRAQKANGKDNSERDLIV